MEGLPLNSSNHCNLRWLFVTLYGLLVMWTGLLRSVEAQAFKPNAFWFCTVTGLIALAAGHALKAGMNWLGRILTLTAALPVGGFYVWCFITEPEKDANLRIATAILASVAVICVATLPRDRQVPSQSSD